MNEMFLTNLSYSLVSSEQSSNFSGYSRDVKKKTHSKIV